MIMIYITENYKTEGRPMATFSFLKEINNENSGEFYERRRERAPRIHNIKLSKKLVNTDVKKYFYSIRVLDEWNRMTEDMVSAKSIHKSRRLYNRRVCSRDGAPQV